MTEAKIYFQKFNPLAENGMCDELTIKAITIFQRDILNWKTPDSRVDPGGKTLQMLYIAAYNPSDAALQNLSRARIILKEEEPKDGAGKWNSILAWGNHPNVSKDFREKTVHVCQELGIKNPSWLMTVMAFESRQQFSSNVPNAAGSSGIGLIQFMKTTIDGRTDKSGKYHPGLGVKIDIKYNQLAGMTNVRQLDVVKAYFQQYGNKAAQANSVDDIYFLVIYPKAYGLDGDTPVFYKGTKEYRDNNFDRPKVGGNNDGIVQVSEISAKIRQYLQIGFTQFPYLPPSKK
ncbi:MAG: hypothetical protein ACR2LT_07785 [Pyrinomonadaceae bacterium]